MTNSKRPKRDELPYTAAGGRMGLQFTSPLKRCSDSKQGRYVTHLGNEAKRRRLTMELEALELADTASTSQPGTESASASEKDSNPTVPSIEESPSQEPTPADLIMSSSDSSDPFKDFPSSEKPTPTQRRTIPNRAANSLSSRWQMLLPTLVEPFLAYTKSVTGTIPTTPDRLSVQCNQNCSEITPVQILCLYHTHYAKISVNICECQRLPSVLVSHGLFPTAPSKPKMAVSVHLLDFYSALFERSCNAVNALAGALNAFYKRRGFVLVDKKGQAINDPFRKGLGYAIQWYGNLHVRIEQAVEASLVSADTHNQRHPQSTAPDGHSTLPTTLPTQPPESGPPFECARILQKRCPACFGGVKFGRSFAEGGDIHVCVDGNFNHRHLRSSGDCPPFYEPEYFISKAEVDSVGEQIHQARQKPPKRRKPLLPDEAVDECESTHVAGSGSNSKTNMEKFDDSGLMALVCRHDIPLFLANIDTPGEQQKYAVALIRHLFHLLPPTATVAGLYDVGCVLDRSDQLYDIFPEDVSSRLLFATSAMHAYVHEWACQLIYNPRLREGLGLTDGEGVERLWSQMRKLIGITRSSNRQRRIWMVDRHVRSIGLEHRAGLGSWIKRRISKGVDGQGATARRALKECGVSTEDLCTQWADQRQAQLSVRSHAPTRLKKELDAVLTLQGQMEAIDEAIENLQAQLTKADAPKNSITLLSSLQRTQEEFKDRGEALYSSLNVHDSFPQLANVDLDFVRVLLTARDLKINIQKRAIGSFLEWDKLDQAAGGREQSLGTKLHQATRSAIAKRAPALMNAIRKFNGYCDTLATMYKDDWSIPLPEPLPVKLAELRESPLLMEDVWISQTSGERPQWLAEPKIREGIRAMLRIDRCLEEQRRLGIEADNLCRWFGRELRALRTALSSPSNDSISILLQQQYEELLLLKGTWSNPLATVERFNAHINSQPITTTSDLTWTPVIVQMLDEDLRCQDNGCSIRNGGVVGDGVVVANDVLFNPDSIDAESAPLHGEDGEDNTELLDLILEEQPGQDVSEQKPHSPITLNWTTDETHPKHTGLLDTLHLPTFAITNWNHTERVLYNSEFRVLFEPKAMDIMSNPQSLLNDTCVNGVAHLLQKTFSDRSHFAHLTSSRCAIFSTYDLPMIRNNTTDSHIWRRTFRTEYWSKDCWIIPIHRPYPALHWVVCWVLPKSREILLFDSFAAREPWEEEIKDVFQLIERLVINANRHNHPLHVVTEEGWTARPVTLHPCQSNGHDCGVWVLATIASVLCGCRVSDLSESDMPTLRRRFLENILALSEFKVPT